MYYFCYIVTSIEFLSTSKYLVNMYKTVEDTPPSSGFFQITTILHVQDTLYPILSTLDPVLQHIMHPIKAVGTVSAHTRSKKELIH